jgi:hypothetical protein
LAASIAGVCRHIAKRLLARSDGGLGCGVAPLVGALVLNVKRRQLGRARQTHRVPMEILGVHHATISRLAV